MKYFLILICSLSIFSSFAQDTLKTKELEEVIYFVPKSPEFPGGVHAMYKWLSENIAYPREAMKKGIQGEVFVRFTVEKDGTISNPQIVKGNQKVFFDEVCRVVLTFPKWTPATQDGKPIDMFYTMPITFKIEMTRKRR